jgi:FkbM family methyltransferase
MGRGPESGRPRLSESVLKEAGREPWQDLRHTARLVTKKPWKNLVDYLRLRRTFRDPLRALAIRHYRESPIRTSLKLTDGRVLHLRAGTTDRHIIWTTFLRDVYRTRSLPDQPLGCVVDVGAHIGSFSVKVAPRASRVLAFEPVPGNFELLKENLTGSAYGHVELFPHAVAEQAGPVRIFLSRNNSGAHSLFQPKTAAEGRYVDVEAVRLPDLLDTREVSRIDYLKLDCEGAEYEILASLEAWGLDRISRIGMEYHPVADEVRGTHSGEEIEERLRKGGFRVERVLHKRDPGVGFIFADRPTGG